MQDREKVIKGLEYCEQYFNCCDKCPYWDDGTHCTANLAHDAITMLKEQDKVGTWKQIDDDTNIWSCSECDEPFILMDGTPIENKYYYCPQCGAKMRT